VNSFQEQYSQYKALALRALEASLPLPETDWPKEGYPLRIVEAMRYSLLAGGKRLRPVLLLAAYNLMDDDMSPALPFASAVEMIHTYSLIHDDLPAMDNDDLRRGKPTSHKVFGEAIAILAGDALLNMAFETMSRSRHPQAFAAMGKIAELSGAGGMIAGQTADILMSNHMPDVEKARYIHLHKTADLLTASLLAGLILIGADSETFRAGEEYGRNLGLAFQITDDLLDLSGDPVLIGKNANKDQALGKMSWPMTVGQKQAQSDVKQAVNAAAEAASRLGRQSSFFRALALSLQNRVE
jgi:geranylgeranyl diphosphate synthase type II